MSGSVSQAVNTWNLESKNFVVTGGTKGIGYATARSLLAHGAAGVLICARSQEDCDKATASLNAELIPQQQQQQHNDGDGDGDGDDNGDVGKPSPTPRASAIACDISTEEGRSLLLQTVQTTFHSKLHGLVNNVGTNVRKKLSEQTPDEYHTMMRTNVDSVYFLCQLLHPSLSSAHGAAVVNVASAAGVRSSGTGAAYGASKAAVVQLSRILACEWARDGIRVNAVAPWMTMTPMLEEAVGEDPTQLDKVYGWTPMGRLASVEEVAGPITFLLMPVSGYVTGQCLGIDGGLTAQGFDGPCVTPRE